MMATRKSSAPQRPKSGAAKKGAKNQYMIAAGVAVILIVLVVIVLTSAPKKAAPAPKSRAGTAEGGTTARSSKSTVKAKSAKLAERNDREARKAARDQERKLRAEARQEGRGRRGRQTSGGGYARSTSRSASSPNELKMIVTDPTTNERYAVVGERRYRAGDDVEGHKILNVGADQVQVEYRQNTYSVRVGQAVY